jgi:hypothetical protein
MGFMHRKAQTFQVGTEISFEQPHISHGTVDEVDPVVVGARGENRNQAGKSRHDENTPKTIHGDLLGG